MSDARPLEELSSSGLLWLINRTVFHPRGFALALVKRNGEVVGWDLLGDGSEVWQFKDSEDAKFEAAQATLGMTPPAQTLTAEVHIDVDRRRAT